MLGVIEVTVQIVGLLCEVEDTVARVGGKSEVARDAFIAAPLFLAASSRFVVRFAVSRNIYLVVSDRQMG